MITIMVGTRPEIVKMAPVIRACETRGVEFELVHSGQHYDYELDGLFFDQLTLKRPDVRLAVGSGSRAEQVGRTREGVAAHIRKSRSEMVLVQGDTNTVIGAALAAHDVGIPIGHVEAGLRCGDLSMVEEMNRRECDAIADLLFAPTEEALEHLRDEDAPGEAFLTGNTVVDELKRQLAHADDAVLRAHGLAPGGYLLATVHRAEGVRDAATLRALFTGIASVAEEFDLPVVLPLHPNTRAKVAALDGLAMERLRMMPALGYHEFLALHRSARMTLTDSGGVQEEACVLGIPCVILRECTERPEAMHVGAACLGSLDAESIVAAARELRDAPRDWPNPFGNGTAGQQIVSLVEEHLKRD